MKNVCRAWMKDKVAGTRQLLGISQQEMASRLNKRTGTYAKYEEGIAMPSVFTLKKICAMAGTTLDEFMRDAPEMEAQ